MLTLSSLLKLGISMTIFPKQNSFMHSARFMTEAQEVVTPIRIKCLSSNHRIRNSYFGNDVLSGIFDCTGLWRALERQGAEKPQESELSPWLAAHYSLKLVTWAPVLTWCPPPPSLKPRKEQACVFLT